MPRELRISATVKLPEGAFDEAAAIVALKEPVWMFLEAIQKAGGEVACDLVTPKVRGEKGEPS